MKSVLKSRPIRHPSIIGSPIGLAGREFSFGVFRDPPGQEWNGFVHNDDEYVTVADGRLRVGVGEIMEAGPGDD